MKNIRQTLADRLTDRYGSADATDSLLTIHGLTPGNFDFVNLMERAINERLNDMSIDDNANKDEKTVGALKAEIVKSVDKAVGFDYLYRNMRRLYGKDEAKRLSGQIYDYSLAFSDSSNTLLPYCYAIDASKLVTIGRDFGQVRSAPARRTDSYIAQLCETVHQMASHLAGAIAIGTFFLDIAYIMIEREQCPLDVLRNDMSVRQRVTNEMQSFVHSVNHLSRGSAESPFTNVSIFDRAKLTTLVKDMRHYFTNIDQQYAVDYIMELQTLFIEFVDRGDPLAGGLPYRFPIVTLNLSKKAGMEIPERMLETPWSDEFLQYVMANVVEDPDFLRYISSKDIFKYNIFASLGTKTASCCRLLNDAEMFELAGQSNSFGGSSISLGSHRVVTVNFPRIALEANGIDNVLEILDERLTGAAKILKAHKDLLVQLTKKGLQPFISRGWIALPRLFSTFGIVGVAECEEILERRELLPGMFDIVETMLVYMNRRVRELSSEFGIIGNIEQIPAESFAVRLAEADRILYGPDAVPYPLYSNQFVPLWKEASLAEKFAIDGKYNQLLTGGGIVHGQVGDEMTDTQKAIAICLAIVSGCEHFALNHVYSICENEHVTRGRVELCPKCGLPICDYLTRVVGFYTKTSSWNQVRREWEFQRRTFSPVNSSWVV